MLHSLILLAFLGVFCILAVMRPMAGVVAFETFSLMSPQQETYGLTGSVPVALVAALATIVGCVVNREPKRFPVNAMTVLVLCFVIQVTISTIFALGPRYIVLADYKDMLKEFGFLFLVAALLTNRRRIHTIVWTFILTIGYYGVKGGLFTILTGGTNHVVGPPNSMINDNNQLAVALLMVVPMMNYARLQSAHRFIRVGLAVAMLLTVIAVVGTYSRGGFLALIAMSAFLWCNSKGKIRSGVLVAVGLIAAISVMPQSWMDRMDSIQHYHQDASADDRLTVWRQAFGIGLARPLTGAGFRATATPSVIHRFYPDAQQRATHSIWMQIFSDGGFPLLIIFIALAIVSITKLRRLRWRTRDDPELHWINDLSRMMEVSMIAFMVGGSFLSLGYYDLYYDMLITIAALAAVAGQSRAASAAGTAAIRQAVLQPARDVVPAWRLRRHL